MSKAEIAAISARRRVHEKLPSGREYEKGFEAQALCISAGHEQGSNDSKHHLKMAVCSLRYVQIFVRAGKADVVKHEVVEVADEGARDPGRSVGAESQTAREMKTCGINSS